jgi:hypothetical protein
VAINRLTHAEQKEVVRKAFPQSSSRWPNIADWYDRQIVPVLQHRRLKRLATEIKAYKEELQGRAKCARSIDIVKAADSAVADGDIDCGWKYLQTARRLELAASQDPAEINAAAIAIRKEADYKLSGWRKTAVNELLTVANGATLDAQKVREAAQIRDEHFNNEAYKDGLHRSSAARLAISLSAAMLALLWIAHTGYLIAATQSSTADGSLFKVLVSLGVVGWLGATISAITNSPRADLPSRIPELVSTFRVTVLRLLMGPALAVIAYFLTQTELSQAIFSLKADHHGYIILIIAFAAGFSERLVLRVIEALELKPSK